MNGGAGGAGSPGGVWLRGASAQQHCGHGHVAVDVPLCVHSRQLARQGVDDFQCRRRDLERQARHLPFCFCGVCVRSSG